MSDTITATMARWAADLRFEDLSDDAVHEARRYLLDSVGCALGGYLQHDCKIALEVLGAHAGSGKSTVFGSGRRMDPISASLLMTSRRRAFSRSRVWSRSMESATLSRAMAFRERPFCSNTDSKRG